MASVVADMWKSLCGGASVLMTELWLAQGTWADALSFPVKRAQCGFLRSLRSWFWTFCLLHYSFSLPAVSGIFINNKHKTQKVKGKTEVLHSTQSLGNGDNWYAGREEHCPVEASWDRGSCRVQLGFMCCHLTCERCFRGLCICHS